MKNVLLKGWFCVMGFYFNIVMCECFEILFDLLGSLLEVGVFDILSVIVFWFV